ncbi:MAG: transcriptional repressor [Firmicutes bacterium]|nr:transcriptional repressor [Bacillota bacterium]
MAVSRNTRQRNAILRVLQSTKSHPTADWVYQQVRQEIPKISLGTVYRNLRLLSEKEQILELNYGSTFSRFDGNPNNHYHFVCRICGAVYDVELPLVRELDVKVSGDTGFKVENHRLEFYGICNPCLAAQNTAGAERNTARG